MEDPVQTTIISIDIDSITSVCATYPPFTVSLFPYAQLHHFMHKCDLNRNALIRIAHKHKSFISYAYCLDSHAHPICYVYHALYIYINKDESDWSGAIKFNFDLIYTIKCAGWSVCVCVCGGKGNNIYSTRSSSRRTH